MARSPRPVPSPVSTILLKIRNTSVTLVEFGSSMITSPANPTNGSCKKMFSGIEQLVKSALQVARSAANAVLAGQAIRLEHNTNRSRVRIYTYPGPHRVENGGGIALSGL